MSSLLSGAMGEDIFHVADSAALHDSRDSRVLGAV